MGVIPLAATNGNYTNHGGHSKVISLKELFIGNIGVNLNYSSGTVSRFHNIESLHRSLSLRQKNQFNIIVDSLIPNIQSTDVNVEALKQRTKLPVNIHYAVDIVWRKEDNKRDVHTAISHIFKSCEKHGITIEESDRVSNIRDEITRSLT